MAGEAPPGYSSGGMVTKLTAARIAMSAGCRMAIANGRRMNPLRAMLDGGTCSWFLPSATPKTARKRWIAGALKPKGKVAVDAGALGALKAGRSLLPAGVTQVEGRFERGDAVVVTDATGNEVARGLIAYNARDAKFIMGHKSREIAGLLGYRGRDEMIHRDDLVLS
jgi:glutamate 5-kinase